MTLAISLLAVAISMLCLGWILRTLLRRFLSDPAPLPVTTEWLSELSADRYRPMLRLLDAADIDFLRTQPGHTPELVERLRRQRIQAFRGYLKLLESDFDRVSTATQLMIGQSLNDGGVLTGRIFERRLRFGLLLCSIRLRLSLFGWGASSAEALRLLQLFEQARTDLTALVPLSSPAVA
jgi:hypothetical protein